MSQLGFLSVLSIRVFCGDTTYLVQGIIGACLIWLVWENMCDIGNLGLYRYIETAPKFELDFTLGGAFGIEISL